MGDSSKNFNLRCLFKSSHEVLSGEYLAPRFDSRHMLEFSESLSIGRKEVPEWSD